MIRERIEAAENVIQEACRRTGRRREEVTLIAVSKTNPVERIREAYDCGLRDFGENKVKEMLGKEPRLPEDIRWHLIGHLQTNKVKTVLEKTVLIHSIDSMKLSDMIDFEARKKRIIVEGLLEVNVAREESKFGFLPEELLPLLSRLSQYRNLKIRGLMTVAPIVGDAEENRGVFRRLRDLSIDIKSKSTDNIDTSVLSMGMTGDYRVAVEEGATLVRVGTGIFGEREIGEERQ
ncbi:MAG: YggS family pyridoxal phosphate-dependent enzyme [Stomatobaculum sp.]